jgi:hypothetical protein
LPAASQNRYDRPEDEARQQRAERDELIYQDGAVQVADPPADEEIDLSNPTTVVEDPDGDVVTELSNGDTEFNFSGEESALGGDDQSFDANLAERMSMSETRTLADLIVQFKDTDISARADWNRMRENALRLLGVTEVDLEKLPFPGAARVYHPVLAEAVVQFQSNAIEEFFPATGPVKGALAGDATDENTAQVDRAETFMNFMLTTLDKGYYADCDQELFVLPIDGSTFKKVFLDPVTGMPMSRFVRADDFIVPFYVSDLTMSPRYIHKYQMTGEEIEMAIMRGKWLQVPLPAQDTASSGNEVDVRAKSDRLRRVMHDTDKLYTILEAHLMRDLPEGVDEYVEYDEEGQHTFMPSYVCYVIEETRELLAVNRLWDPEDPEHTKEVWFSHKKFLPGLGFYGWGFPHVIGALAEAATGAERALLDSALMATMQGGFRAKDGAKTGDAITIEPGKYKEIDATIEELNKTFFNPPFKEPSPALFQMLQSIVQDARRFASITEVLVGTADNKAPVGTTIALIEQSMKLFTAIHKRIFAAAKEEFMQLAKLIYRHAPFEQYPYYVKGEGQMMLKSDFDARVDFIPVADPNIISSVQRIALNQAVLELVNTRPDLYGPEQVAVVHEEFLKALKVPYLDKIRPQIPKPTYVDGVTENAMMIIGKGVKAFPGQAHQAHIMLHQQMIMFAQASLPPDQFEPVYMNAMTHIREHMALLMIEQLSAQMQKAMGVPMPPIDPASNTEDMDPELEMALTITAARLMPQLPMLPAPGGANGGEQAAPDPAADAEAQARALEIETTARIERETTGFVAQQHQDQERHAQQLRQNDELHRQKMKQMDEASAAEIIRKNAQSIAQQRATSASTALKLAQEGRAGKMRSALEREHGETKLELSKKAGEAKAKSALEKPKTKPLADRSKKS